MIQQSQFWPYIHTWSCLVVSDSLWPHGLQPTRLLCPWDFPGNSTGVDCHFLLQGIFPTQGSNLGLLHHRQTLYRLNHNLRKNICTPIFIAPLFTIAKTWKKSVCPLTNEWIKKILLQICDGIVLSHKKEWNNAICRNMDGPRH